MLVGHPARPVVHPVVAPADDYIATIFWMTMVTEVSAFKLKLDPHSLPLAWADLTLCFTVWKSSLNSFYHIAKFSGNHPK
jgi:hypothetical protein